jgi:hypothetical protein
MSSEPSIPSKRVEAAESSGGNGASNATRLAPNDSEDDRVSSMCATELADMASLIAEVKEANRLLKALVAGKSHEHHPTVFKPVNESRDFEEENKKYFEAYDETELKQLTLAHILTVEAATEFRDYFLSLFKSWYREEASPLEEYKADRFLDRSGFVVDGQQEASLRIRGREPTTLVRRHQRMRLPWHEESISTSTPPLADRDVENLVEAQWPVEIAKPVFNLKNKENQTRNYVHWEVSMLKRDPLHNGLLNLFYCSDGSIKSEHFDDDDDSLGFDYVRITSYLEWANTDCLDFRKSYAQGKYGMKRFNVALLLALLIPIRTLSLYTADNGRHRVLSFRNISFISSILLAPRDRTGQVDNGLVADFLCSFADPWKPFQSRLGKAPVLGNAYPLFVQHDISFYSVNMEDEFDEGPPKEQGLDCSREDGYFPVLAGRSNCRFMERRASLIYVDAGYKANFMKPAFRIVVLNDCPLWMGFGEFDFGKLTERGWVIRGVRAGHHLFQAAIFGVLNSWEQQWVVCLDELDKSVSPRVRVQKVCAYL